MANIDEMALGLDERCVTAYTLAVTNGSFSVNKIAAELGIEDAEAEEIRDRLLQLHVLTDHPGGKGLVPIDPSVAEAIVRTPLENEIRQRKEALSHIHYQLRQLAPLYAAGHRPSRHKEVVKVFDDAADVIKELDVTARRCVREVMTIQPGGGRDPKSLREALPRDLALLERGVAMRILYQRTARVSLATRMYVRKVSQMGADVRVSTELFDRLIVFDREVAFIPQPQEPRRPPGAAVVSDPTIVAFCCRLFDNLWLTSTSFDEHEVDPHGELSQLHKSILRLMAYGMKDDLIARRLGMSTRTCRRHISEIMKQLGVTSRFQVGLRASQLGLTPEAERSPLTLARGQDLAADA